MGMKGVLSGIIGIFASLLAGSCCIAPTLFVLFGISAGGLGFLTVLEPYRPLFLAVGYIAVAYYFYKTFAKPGCPCHEPPWMNRLKKGIAWTGLFLLLLATFYPYVFEWIYGG